LLKRKQFLHGTTAASTLVAADRASGSRVTISNSTKGDIMKRLLALALAATFALPSFALLSGCNTVEGAGKDISAGGQKIKEEAKENKKY
jgi:predicted small secreted protein